MSEEEKNKDSKDVKVVETIKTEDAVVSNAELETIEKDIIAKDAAAKKKLQSEVETKVRKEMETEQKLKDLEAEKAKLEATVAKQAKEKEELAKQKDVDVSKLKEQIGSTKQVIKSHSPFSKEEDEESQLSNFGAEMTREQINEIDDNSRKAFMDYLDSSNR